MLQRTIFHRRSLHRVAALVVMLDHSLCPVVDMARRLVGLPQVCIAAILVERSTWDCGFRGIGLLFWLGCLRGCRCWLLRIACWHVFLGCLPLKVLAESRIKLLDRVIFVVTPKPAHLECGRKAKALISERCGEVGIKMDRPRLICSRPLLASLLFRHQHDASFSTPFLHHGFQYVHNV